MHNHETRLRRRPDGSIDTTFYVARGRVERAGQAARLFRSLPARGGPKSH
jgi:hypothetical protein